MPDEYEAPAADDPIVAEVRTTREALSAAADHDLARLYAQLKAGEAAERAAGRPVIAPPAPPAPPARPTAA